MSEVSWSRGLRPNQVAKAGDEVDVQVVKVQQATRKDRFGRVSLSMRACQPDPWDEAKDALRPGVPVKGKVMRTTEFGAFVNPEGMRRIADFPNLTAAMERAGWPEPKIRKIMGENWLRLLVEVWGE